jgi:hypothetical protein
MTNNNEIIRSNVYLCIAAKPSGTRVNPVIGKALNPHHFPPEVLTFFNNRYDKSLSGIYISYNDSLKVKDKVHFEYRTLQNKTIKINSRVVSIENCITFITSENKKVIYSTDIKPVNLISPLSDKVFNIPQEYTIEKYFKLDFDWYSLLTNKDNIEILLLNDEDILSNYTMIRGTIDILSEDHFNILYEAFCDSNLNIRLINIK